MLTNRIDTIILIQSMSNLGGTEIVALNLMNALIEQGMSIAILSLEEYNGQLPNIISLDNSIPRSHRKNTSNIRRRLYDFCALYNVRNVLNFSYENLAVLPFNTHIKTIGVYHWSVRGYEESLYAIANRKPWLRRIASKVLLRRRYGKVHKLIGQTDIAVALTETGSSELRSINGACNALVIPNFLPYTEECPNPSGGCNKRAVFVGRLSREKGVYHLLDIWEKVASMVYEVTLSIYGEGDERQQMEQEIARRNIPRIEFNGFEKDPRKIYSNADVLLCTSETEGFGMVLLEAMYFGVVPVAFDCPVSPKELIADAGITVECFDADGFANETVRLLQNELVLNDFRERGKRRSIDFLKHNVIGKWLKILN